MGLQIQGDIKRLKRKLSIFLDLLDSSSFSQNPLISTPAEKKKKVSFFSQNLPTQDILNLLFLRILNLQSQLRKAKYSLRFRRKYPSIHYNTLSYLLLYTLGPP